MSGAKNPAPFIVYVECCYTDREHKKPIAKLQLSDNSIVKLEPGIGYLGNDAGRQMLNALQEVEAFLSHACKADSKGYSPAPDSIIRAKLQAVKDALERAYK